MHRIIFCLVLISLLQPFLALAGESEARAVALQNGCKPTKIETTQQNAGSMAEVTYTVTCENKVQGNAANTPTTIKVRCRDHMCISPN